MKSPSAPPLWERTFGVVVLYLSTAALVPLLMNHLAPSASSALNSATQVFWAAAYLVAGVLLMRHCKWTLLDPVRLLPLLLLVTLALISVAWSAAPALTLQRSVALGGTTLLGAYLALRYTQAALLRLVEWGFGLVIVSSYMVAFLLPSYGRYTGGSWTGVFSTRGQLGRVAALATVLFLLHLLASREHLLIKLAALVSSFSLVLLSQSKTSFAVVVLIGGLLPLLRIRRWQFSVALPTATMLLSIGILTAMWVRDGLATIALALDRDPTLTGRTTLWTAVWRSIEGKFELGYGYSAFWLGWGGPSDYVWRVSRWEPPHAHNGFLELWLQLGAVGVLLFAMMMAGYATNGWMSARRIDGVEGVFPIVFLVFILISNITESGLLVRNSIYWLLLTAIYIQLRALRLPSPANSSVRYDYGTGASSLATPDERAIH